MVVVLLTVIVLQWATSPSRKESRTCQEAEFDSQERSTGLVSIPDVPPMPYMAEVLDKVRDEGIAMDGMLVKTYEVAELEVVIERHPLDLLERHDNEGLMARADDLV